MKQYWARHQGKFRWGVSTPLERAYALEPSDALKRRLDRLRERGRTSDLPPEYADIPRLPQATRGIVR